MSVDIIAEKFKQQVITDLKFKEKLSFLQIATVDQSSPQEPTPKLRTVLFRYKSELKSFQFDCSTQTEKWQQLLALPKISAVYLNMDNFTQYRFEAKVELIEIHNTQYKEIFNSHWSITRPDLRKELWQSYIELNSDSIKTADINIETPCPLFGTVLVQPYYWDIFTLDRKNFSESKRTQLILKNNSWDIYENTHCVHPLELV